MTIEEKRMIADSYGKTRSVQNVLKEFNITSKQMWKVMRDPAIVFTFTNLDGITMRECKSCEQSKPLEQGYFYKDSTDPHGFQGTCISCQDNQRKVALIDRYHDKLDELKEIAHQRRHDKIINNLPITYA